jgi:cytoskeletal protein CcmA (bactofilin family)
MAIFKSAKHKTHETSATIKETSQTATIITKGTTISGNIIGNDTVHVDGDVEGTIKVDNIVVIGKSGNVEGNIEAPKVISSGKVQGKIKCDELDVMEPSKLKSRIDANRVYVKGKIEGDVLCDEIVIEESGFVEDKVQARSVIVSGSLMGQVACEILSTKSSGYVKGSMFVNNISNEGGKVEGAIGQYQEILTTSIEADVSEKSPDEVKIG